MHSSKLALLLIATGIFIPFVSAPFADGYRRNAGLIENIQSMAVTVAPDRYRPEFRPILTDAEVGLGSKSDQKKNTAPSKYKDLLDAVATATPSTTASPHIDLEPEIAPARSKADPWERYPIVAPPTGYESVAYGDSGKKVFFHSSISDEEVRKVLRAGKHEIESSTSKNLIFFGWTLSGHGLRLPFSFIVSGSLLFAFAGVVMLIFTRKRTE